MLKDDYWQHATYGVEGVAWVGTDDPNLLISPGYGNDWHQYLTKQFNLVRSHTLQF